MCVDVSSEIGHLPSRSWTNTWQALHQLYFSDLNTSHMQFYYQYLFDSTPLYFNYRGKISSSTCHLTEHNQTMLGNSFNFQFVTTGWVYRYQNLLIYHSYSRSTLHVWVTTSSSHHQCSLKWGRVRFRMIFVFVATHSINNWNMRSMKSDSNFRSPQNT